MEDNYKTIVAFDFGLKRIGVATGQLFTKTASPLTTLIAKDGIPDPKEINTIFKDFHPKAIVVGIPLNSKGVKYYISHAAAKFAERLQQKYNLPVYFVDEYQTSIEATAILTRHRKKKKKKYGMIDQTAAVLILERWMADK